MCGHLFYSLNNMENINFDLACVVIRLCPWLILDWVSFLLTFLRGHE